MWACITVTLFDALIDLKTTAMDSKKSRLETSGREVSAAPTQVSSKVKTNMVCKKSWPSCGW